MATSHETRRRIRDLHDQKISPSAIGRRLGLPTSNIRAVLGLRETRSLTEEGKAQARKAFEDGMTLRDMADTYKISLTTACRIVDGITRTAEQKREARARGGLRSQQAQALRRRAKARELAARVFLGAEVEVPPWVPTELRDLYERVGLYKGEHEAAAVVRRLKASGSVACR